MKKRSTLVLAPLFLIGCASSGVLPIGKDTYTISTSNELSPAYAKRAALTEANDFCAQQGKYLVPVNTTQGSHVDSFGDNLATFDFTFRSVAEGDPEIQRPNPRKEADVVIEDRRR